MKGFVKCHSTKLSFVSCSLMVLFALFCSFCFSFLNSDSVSAGSMNGAGQSGRARYRYYSSNPTFGYTSWTPIVQFQRNANTNFVFPYDSTKLSGRALGASYAGGIDIETPTDKFSGHIKVPVVVTTSTSSGNVTVPEHSLNASDIHLGVDSDFTDFNIVDFTVSGYKRTCNYHMPTGSVGSKIISCVHEFDFTGKTNVLVSGKKNFVFGVFNDSDTTRSDIDSMSGGDFFIFPYHWESPAHSPSTYDLMPSFDIYWGDSVGSTDQNLGEINNSLGNINNALGDIDKVLGGVGSSIDDGNRQEQERYEQDKKEESDRENQGKDDADKAKGIFNFSVLNPFSGLFTMFKSYDCISLNGLGGWLNLPNTTQARRVCPWFPNYVRIALTPVFSIASIMLLFGFVVRWLGGSNVTLFKGGF